jgi:hypothetical protein
VALVGSFVDEIFLVDAPCLEDLIHSEVWTPGVSCSKIEIGHVPQAAIFGIFASKESRPRIRQHRHQGASSLNPTRST